MQCAQCGTPAAKMRTCRPPRPSTPAPAASPPRSPRASPGVGFALPGTLTERMTRCGHPTCRCHADPPRLHGPYHQWTRKIGGKTVTRILTDDQLADYQPLVRQPAPPQGTDHRAGNPQPGNRRRRPPLEPLTRPLNGSSNKTPEPETPRSGKRGPSPLNPWAALQPDPISPGQPQT